MSGRSHRSSSTLLRQSGNIFFALFGAVGLVGVLGAATMTIMKGPVAGMQKVTKYTVAENSMIAAGRLAIVAAAEDCDTDDINEPLEWSDTGTGTAPTGGGFIPSGIGAAKLDPWGTTLGYCAWDHGTEIDNAGCGGGTQKRLAGDPDVETDPGGIVLAIISAGPDKVFQTTCGDHATYVTKDGDDIVLEYTYGEARDLAGGLWQTTVPEGDAVSAKIARDIQVFSASDPSTQILGIEDDASQPSLKVDFISKLSAAATGVTFLSDVLVDGGNVGIGITTPLRKLDVAGDGTINGAIASGVAPTGSPRVNMWMGSDSIARIWSGGAGQNVLSLNDTGNVGIGTDAPNAALHVGVDTQDVAIFGAKNGDATLGSEARVYITKNGTAARGTYIGGMNTGGVNHAHSMTFGTSSGSSLPAERMRITHAGDVGIGTTDPQYKLDVRGGSIYVNTSGGGVEIGESGSVAVAPDIKFDASGLVVAEDTLNLVADGSNSGGGDIVFMEGGTTTTSATQLMVIKNSGNVGIGDADPTHTLSVAGRIKNDQPSTSYDLWVQGGETTAAGDARNLALLGVCCGANDYLSINHSSEYTGGTRIGGPVTLNGNTTVTGNLSVSGTYTGAGDNLGSGGTTTGTLYSNNGTYGYLGLDNGHYIRFYSGVANMRVGNAWNSYWDVDGYKPNTSNAFDLGATNAYWKDVYSYYVKTSAGAAATPAHTFAGDVDTGMYRAGADTIGFATGGTATLVFNSTLFRPHPNNTVDLGHTSYRWKDMYLAGDANISGNVMINGAIYNDHSNATYDLWLQGNASSTAGTRNLAILGNATVDRLYINYPHGTGSEYAAGTQIGSPVGIGTAPVASRALLVSGDVATYVAQIENTYGADSDGLRIIAGNSPDQGSNTHFIEFLTDGSPQTDHGSIGANGNGGLRIQSPIQLDITSSTNISGTLTASGDVRADGDLRFATITAAGSTTLCRAGSAPYYAVRPCSSLRRFKDDIVDLSMGLDTLMQLRPRQFDWIEGDKLTDDIGFIAEEVKEVSPYLADYTDDTRKELLGVRYNSLVSLTVKAVQEIKTLFDGLLEKVDGLADTIGALQKENAALRERVIALEAQNADMLKRMEVLEAK